MPGILKLSWKSGPKANRFVSGTAAGNRTAVMNLKQA